MARRTSITRSDGGLSASTDISPPGAPTTAVTGRCATNTADSPAGDQSPNSPTARACPGSSPRADSASGAALAMARNTVAAVSGAVPSGS